MMSFIVDTNIWLRYLVKDDKQQYKQASDWFKQAEKGLQILVLKPVIVAESCFVLESFYKHKRDNIAEAWQTILAQKWLQVDERKELLGLWPFYLKGFHWVDSYQMSWSQVHKGGVLTFDKDLEKELEKQTHSK